ncbi:MAG: hypothetical protein QXO37_08795 [Candidatus Nitrosocaldaceae archaeon]
MNILTSLFSNKVALFNIILVSSVLIFLLITNVQQEVNIEEYATIPFDNTPVLEEVKHEYNGEVELVYDKDTFQIEYRIGKWNTTVGEVVVITGCNEESKPLPMSPATSIFYLDSLSVGEGSLSLALAIKKVAEDPAVYGIKIEDNIVCYFSDPFPTGYNSIIIYTTIEDKDKVRIEISKIRSLG